ncbi:hypothetical protein [Natrialba taiwanensis]|uniref:Molybdopterin cofactor biosynthesis MoaD-related C-terminal domain-containing protein n=1 Tax=Natrialba taiwanensis DSM 12281 TaxID=1230458 RepID=L9ZR99_9EURY|nr:hypothetical protein [Natrialba taiwanensis]ELY88889.1 hypothetical protein C484_14888 [Natrialba taiwanensis DSM 12281]
MERRIERSFRGISERLAVRYLSNLGGERVQDGDETTVEADDWTATITSESVDIGPTLTLTEVTIVFERDENDDADGSTQLDELVDTFAQKAMRAGG